MLCLCLLQFYYPLPGIHSLHSESLHQYVHLVKFKPQFLDLLVLNLDLNVLLGLLDIIGLVNTFCVPHGLY